jgi:hypothetical protein
MNAAAKTPLAGQPYKRPQFAVTPPAIELTGDSGAGKSSSIITLLKAGLDVRVLITEGRGAEALVDAFERAWNKDKTLDFSRLHWKQVLPSNVDLAALKIKAGLSNSMGAGELQKLEDGLERRKYPQFMNLLRAMESFEDENTGRNLGNVATWDDNVAFVIDSQTGINTMIAQHVCGHRPTMTQPEFGIAQNHAMDLINMWTSLSCFFVVTGHMEKEINPNTGVEKLTIALIGKAISHRYHIPFSEALVAYRTDKYEYFWSNTDTRAVTKARYLPRSHTLAPDFGPIVKGYRDRKHAVTKEVNAPTSA